MKGRTPFQSGTATLKVVAVLHKVGLTKGALTREEIKKKTKIENGLIGSILSSLARREIIRHYGGFKGTWRLTAKGRKLFDARPGAKARAT